MSTVPGGIWAVASDLADADAARRWARGAAAATCWTYRRPPAPDAEALRALRVLAAAGKPLQVHARLDLAFLDDTAGVIAGVRSLPPAELRRLLPEERLLGMSVHDEAEAAAAADAGADYLIFGPVWATPEKEGVLAPRGLDGLAALVAAQPLPVVAIGGIEEEEQIHAAREAGAVAAAVLRAAREPERLQALAAVYSG